MEREEYIPCLGCQNRIVAEGHDPYCPETGLTVGTREEMLDACRSCRISTSLYAKQRQNVPLISQLQPV